MDNMKFYVLNCGGAMGDLGWFIAMYRPATVENLNPPRIWHKIPFTSFLIDHPSVGWILFDTGPSPRALSESYWTQNNTRKATHGMFPISAKEEDLLPAQLEKINLKPEDIGTVVISHLHWDHCGNLELFPHAKIYVHREDFSNALVWTHQTPERDHEFYIGETFTTPKVTWTLIDEDTEIAENVELITLAGHTPGVLGMLVHLEKFGTILCPSDSVFTPTNLGPPPHPPGIIYDTIAFTQSVWKVLKLREKYNAKIFYNHYEDIYSEYKLIPEYYE
jgi:N-acyl homoserine lactone hydrolase